MINEASIKCFMALCETLSFTEAARQLFMTQQSVSKYIAKLEEDLGFQLGRGSCAMLAVTDAGLAASLTEKLQGAAAGVIVDYKGITVAEDTELRAECRKNDVEYAVVKNTLLRFAFNNVGLNELDDQLNGTTSLAIAADPVAPARVIADFAKKLNGKFEIKGGFMDGKVVDMATVNALAAIPALPVLQAQVLGTMLAPISGLACVLKQIAEKNGAPAEEASAE